MLDKAGVEIDGRHAVVIGRSNIVGFPVAKLLLDRNATVTIAHSHTQNLGEITRMADILVVATTPQPRKATALQAMSTLSISLPSAPTSLPCPAA